jgi:hypothetical protein
LLKEYKPETAAAMEVITTVVITNLEAAGITVQNDFDAKSPKQRFLIATEGISEWVSRIWKAIADFMNKIWTWLKSFFKGSSKSEAAVENIEKITTAVRNFEAEEKILITASTQGDYGLNEAARKIIAERNVNIPNFRRNNESSVAPNPSKDAGIREKLQAFYKNKNRDDRTDDLKIQGIIPACDMGNFLPCKRLIRELEYSEQAVSQILVQSVWVSESAEAAMKSGAKSYRTLTSTTLS